MYKEQCVKKLQGTSMYAGKILTSYESELTGHITLSGKLQRAMRPKFTDLHQRTLKTFKKQCLQNLTAHINLSCKSTESNA